MVVLVLENIDPVGQDDPEGAVSPTAQLGTADVPVPELVEKSV